MSAEPDCIEVDRVSFGYSIQARPVVRGVSVRVQRGEWLGVLGPNGAGKSTLLRLMAGLRMPTTGTVTLFGQRSTALSRAEMARRVAVVPQRETGMEGFSVREIVSMGRAPHLGLLGTSGDVDRDIVNRALADCDATSLSERFVHELSGGEFKRVTIARALAQRASVVLLDEPVAHLDIGHQLSVCDLLRNRVSAGEFSAVAVLHDLNLAAQYCDRVLLLRDGETVALGSVDDVLSYRRIRDTFGADVYVGQNEINGTRYFVPMRSPIS